MVNILIDTSIFIEFSRQGSGKLETLMLLAAAKKVTLYTTSVVLFEFWTGKSVAGNEASAQALFKGIEVVPLTTELAQQAGALAREGSVSGIDAIVAAAALSMRAELATLNLKHFKKIPLLKLWNEPVV